MARKPETVNTTEAAEIVGVSRRTFGRIASMENVDPYSKIGNEVRYRKTEVEAIARKQKRKIEKVLAARSGTFSLAYDF